MDAFSKNLDSWIAGPHTRTTLERESCEHCGETWTVRAVVEYGAEYPDETLLETIERHRAACEKRQATRSRRSNEHTGRRVPE